MKQWIVFLFITFNLSGMERDPEHPRYHINNKIVYLHEVRESGDAEFRTVSEFNNSQPAVMKEAEPPKKETFDDIAVIRYSISNRTKVIIAAIGACSSIAIATISVLVTYYSSQC